MSRSPPVARPVPRAVEKSPQPVATRRVRSRTRVPRYEGLWVFACVFFFVGIIEVLGGMIYAVWLVFDESSRGVSWLHLIIAGTIIQAGLSAIVGALLLSAFRDIARNTSHLKRLG